MVQSIEWAVILSLTVSFSLITYTVLPWGLYKPTGILINQLYKIALTWPNLTLIKLTFVLRTQFNLSDKIDIYYLADPCLNIYAIFIVYTCLYNLIYIYKYIYIRLDDRIHKHIVKIKNDLNLICPIGLLMQTTLQYSNSIKHSSAVFGPISHFFDK